MSDERKKVFFHPSSLSSGRTHIMTEDPRVQQLLDELHALHATPEEVCGSCPELLPVVRDRWRQICRVRADLDALFPPPADATPQPPGGATLPQIPGYEVEALLGHGGMGIVFRARHLRLNRTVALKMLRGGVYAGPQDLARFQREVEAEAGLRHPHIVGVHDVGEHDSRPYFTMEYVEGGSLAQKLGGTPQPARQAAALVATLAEAVQVAHQGGIVHRDLKPANILLTADGTPKISDFGLARRLQGEAGLTQSGVPMGTPSYMAPEQARGENRVIGPAVDIYALGAVLYELLTGRPPFRGETAAETVLQVIHQEPASPSQLNAKVPRDLETICLKCLHKEPQRRYASAQALADDLRRFGEGRPIQARPVGWTERLWRWGRRNPAAAALLATALVLVGLASGGGVWLVQQQAERRAEAARHDTELRNDVGTAVVQAESLRSKFHFLEARQLLEQAWQRLEPAGPDDLRRQVEQGRTDLDLAERLDTAHGRAVVLVVGKFNPAQAEALYASAFAEAGLGREGDDIQAAAARVRGSALREEIVAALDDWASLAQGGPRQAWLLAVAREADPNPTRNRLRKSELWQDGVGLAQVIQEANVAELSPQLATALARVAREHDMEAVPLLTAAVARFPQSFWLNLDLASTLVVMKRYDEALSYCRVAVAIRPEVAAAHHYLGVVQYYRGQLDESVDHQRQAASLEPDSAWAHTSLAVSLEGKGLINEAIDQFHQALRLEPSAYAHFALGACLARQGRRDEAINHLFKAIELDPKSSAFARTDLAQALRQAGRVEEAVDQLQQAVQLEPTLEYAKTNLGHALYPAARAAVLTATGQGSNKARPGQPEQAYLRNKALGWLRANLELTAKLQNEGKMLRWSLTDWQMDPALASVRDAPALAKLPDVERKEWQCLWADVAAQLAADPLEQGRVRAARRDWDRAADRYARALARCPTDDSHFWFEYAALALLSGDRPGYNRACAHMIERCGKPGGPRAYHTARACTLAPDAVADPALPGRLAERELHYYAGQFWSLTEQGALAYRAGRFQESIALFEQSLQANSKPGAAVLNWLWLALAHQRLGKSEEARRWLTKAQAWLDPYSDGMPALAELEVGLHLHNWLEAHVLRREAEALLSPK
jgi:tetratricopeptide (TPR) repeat protein